MKERNSVTWADEAQASVAKTEVGQHEVMDTTNQQDANSQDTVGAMTDNQQSTSVVSDTEDNSETGGRQEIWFLEEERWELTWPIWHMLSREERRSIAHRHGYKTIGEFEEYMTLQRAVGASENISDRPYPNELVYASSAAVVEHDETETDETTGKAKRGKIDDDDDDEDSVTDELEDNMESEHTASMEKMSTEELLQVAGKILVLPEEMLHRVFEWLPVDTYATLALVSPHWKSFTRTETVYKRLCERLYLKQSRRRALHVSRFGNSYRTMLEKRPRVRAGGGVYVMKYTRIKRVQRDMWTEVPHGAILEMTYYRYLYFQEDGRVLYALTNTPPHEMFPRLLKVCLTRQEDKVAVWGTYQVHKRHVVVTARQEWQYVKLEMTIQPYTLHGRFGYLSFDSHETCTYGNFDDDYCVGRVVYDVPEEPFRFIPDKRM